MRFSPRLRSLAILALFAGALVLLRQGILGLNSLPGWQERAALVAAGDIDTSALFYTELPQALQAEKAVRKRIAAATAPSTGSATGSE